MKTLFAQALCLVFLILSVFSCTENKEELTTEEVTVNIRATNLLSDTVSIVKYDMLNHQGIPLAEVVLDSGGTGTMKFKLAAPTFAAFSLEIQDQRMLINNELYLSPGDAFQVTVDGADVNHTIQYQGRGADVNNYLAQSFLVRHRYFRNKGKFIWQLETPDFLNRLDSIKDDVTAFHQQYSDSLSLPDTLKALMEKKNQIELINTKYNYVFLLHNNFMVDAMVSGKKVVPFTLPESLMNVDNEVPYDTTFLDLGLQNYAYLLRDYFLRSVLNPFFVGKTEADIGALNSKMPTVVDSLLRSRQLPAGFQDYFLAKNIDEYMMRQGISPNVDTIYQTFEEKNADSKYLPSLEKRYDRWLAIQPGTLAPDFYGTTPEGSKLSLSDLRGQVVYVDVWATWCRPCIEEFPASKKLQRQFADNDKVVFLYVSVDRDQEAWQKFLTENPELRGTHIVDTAPAEESIRTKYMLSGFPSYILIDQSGKIINTNAARPSSDIIHEQINALLRGESTVKG